MSVAKLSATLLRTEPACVPSPDPPSLGGGADAGPTAAAPSPIDVKTCAATDLEVAREGMTGAFWITRLRAKPPASAFADDLRLEASPTQEPVSSAYTVVPGRGAMIAPVPPSGAGSVALFGVTVAGLVAMLGRRRRKP